MEGGPRDAPASGSVGRSGAVRGRLDAERPWAASVRLTEEGREVKNYGAAVRNLYLGWLGCAGSVEERDVSSGPPLRRLRLRGGAESADLAAAWAVARKSLARGDSGG